MYSFKSTINTLFVPIVVFCIVVTALISMRLATAQIEENAYNTINDTIFQTKSYVEYTLSDVFAQLVSLSYDSHLATLLRKDAADIMPEDYVLLDKNIQLIFSRYSRMLDAIVIDLNDQDFLLYRSEYHLAPTISYDTYFAPYDPSSENFYWRNVARDDVFQTDRDVVTMYRLLSVPNHKGVVLFQLKESFFKQVLDRSLIGSEGYLTLVDEHGAYETNHAATLDAQGFQQLQQVTTPKGQFIYENDANERIIVAYDTITTNNWKIAAVVPEHELLQKVTYIKHVTIILIILMISCVIFLTNRVIHVMSKPLEQLARQMNRIDEHHLTWQEPMSGPKEMTILHNGFQELLTRIQLLMEQVKLEQEDKRQLEFAIMQAQINPHFLYNTLYAIKGLCDMGLNEEASEMVSALSNFFRIGISKGQEVITIEEELEHIHHYLYIQEMRYGDDFAYEVAVDKTIYYASIMKLSLQPLIENAIYHGVKQKRGKGCIEIHGYEQQGTIYLEVRDNGKGMTEERLQQVQQALAAEQPTGVIGIGLRSVHERIKIHFGKQYGMTIESKEGVGTVVRIQLPKT